MDLQIKVFRWPDTGHYIIVITHGLIDIKGFKEIFSKVAPLTEPLQGCKVVIDLQDATCRLEPADIHGFVTTLDPDLWPNNNKVALVSASKIEQYDQLFAEYLSIGSGFQNSGLLRHKESRKLASQRDVAAGSTAT
jgi:hypothetical protein